MSMHPPTTSRSYDHSLRGRVVGAEADPNSGTRSKPPGRRFRPQKFRPAGWWVWTMAVACLLAGSPPSMAQEWPSLEDAAARLQETVVTVRIQHPREAASSGAAGPESNPGITVCSGVYLGDGQIVAPVYAASDSVVRITFPGGLQGRAQVRVIDEYSGLTLLDLQPDSETPPPSVSVELAEELPRVGAWVLTGAAWGSDKPVVSLGIIGGLERNVPDVHFPPLIQCDLRTTETSSGAALVDRQGRLIGIVVLVHDGGTGQGWTYAVPVHHVRRLLAASETTTDGGVMILKRRRPEVGMVLDGERQQVAVSRVTENGPAFRAGVRSGDRILAVDGIRIRSVYQALRPVLWKQPGDTVTLEIARGERTWEATVTLGGGMELPSAPFANLSQLVRPKIEIETLPEAGRFRSHTARGVREVFAPDPAEMVLDEPVTDAERIALLQRALERYHQVIIYMQDQLRRREEENLETRRQLEALQRRQQERP